jgi:superfamily II DNA/RNA helicase
LLSDPSLTQAIIFTATKRQADHLVEKLAHLGRSARALHGGMNQRQRTRTIREMREEEFSILVATDVAARGIDIQTITHVFNFDLPRDADDYVHRIGRTGRAGASGIALSFAASRDMSIVRQIEKLIGKRMDLHQVTGMEPKAEATYNEPRSNDAPRKREFRNKGKSNQYKAKPRRWYP